MKPINSGLIVKDKEGEKKRKKEEKDSTDPEKQKKKNSPKIVAKMAMDRVSSVQPDNPS